MFIPRSRYGLTVNVGTGGGDYMRKKLIECNAEIEAAGGTGRLTYQVFARPQ